jgi:hypothetical protein
MAIRIAPVEETILDKPKKHPKQKPVAKLKAPKGEDGRKRSGFASMTLERRREVAAKGGKSVAKEKRFWAANPEKAKQARQTVMDNRKARNLANGQT